jgi:hypothetical protein
VVSAAVECVLNESKVQTWPVKEVTLSSLLAADFCLSDVTATAAAESAAVAHPRAAPPYLVHSFLSEYPSVAGHEYLALRELDPTPSHVGSFEDQERPGGRWMTASQ